jgi:hypothetical protein
MIDLDALEAAGIRDAHARRELLEYLDSLGFTADEMVAAERHGRLFALAGDAVMRSGSPVHSLRSAAKALCRPLEEVQQAWAALGLTVADVDQIAPQLEGKVVSAFIRARKPEAKACCGPTCCS